MSQYTEMGSFLPFLGPFGDYTHLAVVLSLVFFVSLPLDCVHLKIQDRRYLLLISLALAECLACHWPPSVCLINVV